MGRPNEPSIPWLLATGSVKIQTRGNRYRVEVVLDLQEQLIFVPSGLLPDIVFRNSPSN